MGYGFYYVGDRPAGYMVLATCDRRGCGEEIDRGMGYLCGDEPHGPYSDAPGCGRYYCEEDRGLVGPRGGCDHRRAKKAWGKTLSCMYVTEDGDVVCTLRAGHATPHFVDE